ncbi:hypothetical protein BZB76_6300 [Actinomadura pelletieri DSM 43383]|uniref:Uncharacterized protein n=1 Tax=Actinomadura pelletieri DSM 43383 TaxID=1120940 RepID=A0A495Q9P4_9ACTN|nr:hypothetical protein BZB76_6300 [Actinomadura pelletieri DSM 43383]
MLREAALRVTRPQLAVLSAEYAHPHADTDSTIRTLHGESPKVSHQTVYHSLQADGGAPGEAHQTIRLRGALRVTGRRPPPTSRAGSGLESATLEVVQTLQRVGGALRFVPPKTDDSKRRVPLPDLCITALCEHKVRQETERTDAWPN